TASVGLRRCLNTQSQLDDKQRPLKICEPYFLSFSLVSVFSSVFSWATAWAFAPRISARNGWAAAGADTLPNSRARVVTLCPYIATLESVSWRIDAPSNVSPANAPLAREYVRISV